MDDGASYMDDVFDQINSGQTSHLNRAGSIPYSTKTSKTLKYLTSSKFNRNLTNTVYNDDLYALHTMELVRNWLRPAKTPTQSLKDMLPNHDTDEIINGIFT